MRRMTHDGRDINLILRIEMKSGVVRFTDEYPTSFLEKMRKDNNWVMTEAMDGLNAIVRIDDIDNITEVIHEEIK